MARLVPGGKTNALDVKEAPPIVEKLSVKTPTRFFGAFVKIGIVARIQHVQHAILIKRQIGFVRPRSVEQARTELFGETVDAAINAPDVFTRAGVLRAKTPHRFALHEFGT